VLALTVTQPWTWAIFNAGKDVENRSWSWPKKVALPKRLLIHASKDTPRDEYVFAVRCIWEVCRLDVPPIYDLAKGAVLGAVTVTACVTESSSLWFGGPYGLTLERAVALSRPVPCKGRLGLWTVPENIELEVRAAAKERGA